ncbi:helix-turn-helix domain-containing protein [Steroidobacter agaridevorans]|uniref:helix-turn-helix domain-containing protein n=1 Tax=Steroidobacter agaridevorans TaxID=2695856 RepID=UPI0013797C46
MAALERHYFAVLFRKSIGMTFVRFVRERRVHHAMHLLERSSSSIASIAWAVGYRDCTGLARVFREALGMSPRKARQLLCSASARVS